MLLYHFKESMADVIMRMETTKQAPIRNVNIRLLSVSLGESVTQQLPVIHAISGCDTTSSLFGRGKASIFKYLVSHAECASLVNIVGNPQSSDDEISTAGL